MLGYKEWRKFDNIINKAKISCDVSNYIVLDHFVQLDKMVEIGSKTKRNIKDYKLSRYACYLITQNGDSHMITIALAQTDAKLKRDKVDHEYTANSVHYEVGKKVRNSIKRMGGTMPEDLPMPNKSLKEVEKETKKLKE